MKQFSIILNIILLVAVGILYFKVFGEKESQETPLPEKALSSRIVFVDSDSLLENYSLFKEMENRLDAKRDSLERMLSLKGQALEREMKEYQQKAAGMSEGERQLREESLMRKQQAIMQERDDLLDKLKAEDAAMSDSIHNDLLNYLKEYNKSRQFDFILGYSRGGGILFANDSLDITKQVLEGLNK